jgi:hypothetical protein
MDTKLKLGFIQLDQGKTYKLHVFPVDQIYMNSLHYRSKMVDNMFCPHCENEKINSRFDILDL